MVSAAPINSRMRITFWGTQGSLQYFPAPEQIEAYGRHVALETLRQAFTRLAGRFGDGSFTLAEALDGPIDDERLGRLLDGTELSSLPVYGGETTCAEVQTADGNVFIIDGGSGFRHFSKDHITRPLPKDGERRLIIFGTHDHLDHRIGLPFSAVCFARPPYRLDVYGNYCFLDALDARFAVFSHEVTPSTHRDDPLDYRLMSAAFHGTQILCADEPAETDRRVRRCRVHDAAEPLVFGRTRITPFPVYHAASPCLAYKFEHDGASFVFCTDHELRRGPDGDRQRQSAAAETRLREYCRGVDVAYFDGQYQLAEYAGEVGIGKLPAVPRLDWGHGCIEDAIERAADCGIGRTYIGHHDPEREWLDRLRLDQLCRESTTATGRHIELAKDRLVVEI